MGARELLHELAGAGLTITADGDRLLIRPAAKLTDNMRGARCAARGEARAADAADPARSTDPR
jgi:virulence-associated protein VagC